MPFFIIERRYADVLEPTPESAAEVTLINDEESVRWLYSFLSVDLAESRPDPAHPDDMGRARTDIEKRCAQRVLVAC